MRGAPAGERPAATASEPLLSLHDLLHILRRRAPTIALVVAVVTLPSFAVGVLRGPQYTATASVLIEPNLPAGGATSPLPAIIDTQADILKSRTLVRRTMQALALYDHPDYRVDPADMAPRFAWLTSTPPADPAAPEESPEKAAQAAEERAHDFAAEKLAEDLKVSNAGDSYVLTVSFKARDPDLAAAVANALATAYLDRQVTEKREAARRSVEWLSGQLAAQREDVLATERDLAELRAKHLFVVDKAVARSEGGVLLQDLERAAAVKRSSYDSLLTRLYEAEARLDTVAADARIISRAESPTKPSSPSPILFAAVGFTASGVLGVLAGLMREALDRRLRTADRAEALVGLSCLAVVPAAREVPLHRLVHQSPQAPAAQAVRSVAVRLLATDPPPVTVAVTTTAADPGAAGLAAALACVPDGGRTVLVDLDLTTPRLPALLDLKAAPGGEAATVLRDVLPGVDVLCLAAARPAPLTDAGLRALMADLRHRYDRVLVAAPSASETADACLVARNVDAVVFAERPAGAPVDRTAAAVASVAAAGGRVLGIVLLEGRP